jgi:hypothetical protein
MTSGRARWITFAILATVPWLASAGDRVDPASVPTTNGHRPAPFTQIATQDDTGLTLAIRIPRSALELHPDADEHRVVSLASVHHSPIPGAPELPVIVISVAVPLDAEIRVNDARSKREIVPGPPVRPVAGVDPLSGERTRNLDRTLYQGSAIWPERTLVVERARVRDLSVVRLLVYPVDFDPTTNEIGLTLSWDIRLDFVEGNAPTSSQKAAASTVRAAALVANPGVKVLVAEPGLVRITSADLQAIGFDPAPVDPRNLEISYRGVPIPCRVTGESDGSFDVTDAVEFYGIPGSGRHSRHNVYWLAEKDSPGLRLATRDAAPTSAPIASTFLHTEHFEEGNTIYTFGRPAEEGDPHFFWKWFEDNPNSPRVTTFTHSSSLPGLSSGPTAFFRALLSGRTDTAGDPDHRVRFTVNGTQIGDTVWDGKAFHTAEIPFDPALLVGGSNDFRLDYVSIAVPDIYYLDWLEIVYPRSTQAQGDRLTIAGQGTTPLRYDVSNILSIGDPVVVDVTDPFSPVELTGFATAGSGPFTISFEDASPEDSRYLVAGDNGRTSPFDLNLDAPSTLQDPSSGADLIIVVPDGWEEALQPLVDHRRAGGLRVVLASLTDVADEFAGGNIDDLAVRDFVAHAYANWQPPAVSYLLLVGEPNLDAMNDLGQTPFYNLMPTHFGVTGAQGETMTDTWFGAVAGDDLLPDVAVARFSVRNAADAAAVAAKIIDYESNPPDGAAWGRNVLLVASNETTFEDPLDDAATFLPAHYTVDRQYRRSGATGTSVGNAFDAGALVASFLGHGNVTYWADSPGGPFFDLSDVDALQNAGRLPFVTALNCLNGLIAQPFITDSFAEEFHKLQTTGALAIASPSAVGFISQYEILQSILFRRLFQDPEPHIGAAVSASLVESYLTAPISIDLVKEIVLLGDPSGWVATDKDDDGLLDHAEIGSGANSADRDSDDDGLLDGSEPAPDNDTDADGTVNVLDTDADNDGLADGLESGVTTADVDTDLARGFFRADQDPASMTDPLAPDTDGGGAPDGAEDVNTNGIVDGSETDPQNPLDDPACSLTATPEIGAGSGQLLRIGKSADDITLDWGADPVDPCMLYRVYVADDFDDASGALAFGLRSVTGATDHVHTGAANDGLLHRYLIVGATLHAGEGPWGHFGR